MIPIQIQHEPDSFNDRVRQPGKDFLTALGKKPTHKDYRKNWYWNRVKPELYQAYKGICAYSASWIPSASGTIDHFIPRSCSPELAYEWNNYRLAMEKLGNYKDRNCECVDPLYIKFDWFTLDFPTFRIVAAPSLPKYLERRVRKTIEVLRLNTDNSLIEARVTVIGSFANGVFPLGYLEKRFPFIAYELKRQGMETKIKAIFQKHPPIS